MTVYELIQVLARYPAGTEVYVSQKWQGYTVQAKWHELEDGVVKLYGDGSVDADGNDTSRE